MIIDLFAGAGGASVGIEQALGRSPDVAVDHWPRAVETHARNHPETRHITSDVRTVDPTSVATGPCELLWLSPDCTHHSRARGGKPRSQGLRMLPWEGARWAAVCRPRVLILENVPEITSWGPLDAEGHPIAARAGESWGELLDHLRALGYRCDHRVLRACDYGAPTTRKRLFLIARGDGVDPQWPEPTHGPGLLPYRTAADCIDWSIPCPSIFTRTRPLAEATMRRIAEGIRRFVVGAGGEPFIAHIGQKGGDHPVGVPTGVVMPTERKALVTAFLAKHYGGVVGQRLDRPIGTVTAVDHHSLVGAFLVRYNGDNVGQPVTDPVGALTGKPRFGLVQVHGEEHVIVDIGMRMLTPRELARAQGFPDDYVLTGTIAERIKQVGNSVCPAVARALVAANAAGIADAPGRQRMLA